MKIMIKEKQDKIVRIVFNIILTVSAIFGLLLSFRAMNDFDSIGVGIFIGLIGSAFLFMVLFAIIAAGAAMLDYIQGNSW